MSENKKKVPLTGAERAKRFYDKNKESESARTNEYYKNKRIAQGFPAPKKQKSYPKQSTETPSSSQATSSTQSTSSSTQSTSSSTQSTLSQTPLSTKTTSSTQTEPSRKTTNTISTQTDPEPEAEPEPVIEDQPVSAVVSDDKISALEKISILINNIPNETKGNITFRINNFKTILKILKTPLYKAFITKITSNPTLVINSIKEAEFRGKKYSTRSILAYFNSILFLLDKHPNIKITKEKKKLYQNQSSVMSFIADEEGDEKKKKLEETGGLPSYEEYLNKVIEKFGNEGREYLIAVLYRETKARDDLILKIVRSGDDADGDDNYLIIGKGPQANVVIKSYKTIKKYGEFDVKLSNSLTSLIRKYLKDNKISYNDYLFNTKSLSVIVSRMNKAIGVTGYGATNVFRKMLQTDLDRTNATPEQKIQLANELKHSTATAKKSYIIKKK